MFSRNTISSYGSVSKFLHWAIFLLVTAMLIFGFYLSEIPKKYAGTAYNLHKLTGLVIFFSMLFRLVWSRLTLKPDLSSEALPWQRFIEKMVHSSLYLAIISMALVAWVASSVAGRPPGFLGYKLGLPMMVFNKSIIEPAFILHKYIGFLIIGLVGIHVCAALYHHYIKKDTVLKRMIPFYPKKTFRTNV